MNYHYMPIYLAIVGLAVSYFLGYMPLFIFVVFAVASLVTYFIYAKDKKAARLNRWRTSEKTLHFCSILCGWPGAIIAQQRLRHKSQKQSFRVVFMFTLLLNVALIASLHTVQGATLLRQFTHQLQSHVIIHIHQPQLQQTLSLLLAFRTDDYIYKQSDTFYIRESRVK